jgi:hypothetical protein
MQADTKKTLLPVQAKKLRNGSGSVLSLLPVAVMIGLFGLGAIGLDIAHNVTTRTALQDATDAAALAGAAYLVIGDPNAGTFPATNDPSNGSAPNDQSTSGYSGATVTAAESEATTVAGNNVADGRPVSQTATPGCTVTATVNQPSSPNSGSTVPGHNGQCIVNGSIPIKNMFAGIFGHPTDIVSVTSIATAYSTVNSVAPNTVFPIAVSLDTLFGHNPSDNSNKPLYMCNIGDTETFTLDPELCANAAWTTFDVGATNDPVSGYGDGSAGTYINNAFNSVTGNQYQQNLIHSQYVGQAQGLALWADLNNGAQPNISSIYGQTVNLPIMSGDAPYRSGGTVTQPGTPISGYNNATQIDHAGCRPLIGFVGFKITSSTTDANGLSTITGTIVKTLVKGTPGVAFPAVNNPVNTNISGENATLDAALANLSPAVVLLGNNVTGSSNGLNSGAPGNTQTFSSGGGFSQTAEQNGGPLVVQPMAGNGFVQSNLQNIPLPSWMEGTAITQAQVDGVNVSGSEGTFFNAVPEYVNGQLQSTRQAVGFTNYMIQENQANQTVTVVFVDEVNLDGAPANPNTQSNPVPAYNISTGQPDSTYGPEATLWTGTSAGNLQQLPVNPSITTVVPISNATLLAEGGQPDTQNGVGSPSYNYQITVKLPPLNSSQLPLYLQVAAHDTDRSNDFGIQIFNLQFGASQCPVN